MKNYLSRDEFKLYSLIWNRFVASQMKPALFDETIITVEAKNYEFEASGQVMTFPGFIRVYQEETAEAPAEGTAEETPTSLPVVENGQELRLDRLEPKQNFTQPPSAFYRSSAGERTGRKRNRTSFNVCNDSGCDSESQLRDQGRQSFQTNGSWIPGYRSFGSAF